MVHDYIKEYGGAERVLEALHELYPDAPVYTTVYLPEFLGPHKDRFKNWDIRTSWAQNLPFKSKLISPLRLIAPFLFRSFDFSKYDVVIVSATGAYCPNTIRCHPERSEGSRDSSHSAQIDIRRGPLHISYTHTPPRYLYGYATAKDWKKNLAFRVLGEFANHFLRMVDFRSSQNVDFFISNSEEVRSRIKKFYRKDAVVIYPPVNIDDRRLKVESRTLKIEDRKLIQPLSSTLKNPSSTIHHPSSSNDYFLAGGRLARAKHIDLIVQAFNELKLPLKVFGKGFAGNKQEEISNKEEENIEFVGEVSDEEKIELMKNAKAYVNASEDEDFGITPVEAMSVGTPVIAYFSGGLKETVEEGRTGVFFNELTVESLKKAVNHYNDTYHQSMRTACVQQAQKFSKERFRKEILSFVSSKVKTS